MSYRLEVLNRYAAERSCDALLYAPLSSVLTCRETRVYEIAFSGDGEALRAFARRVLVDDVTEEICEGADPAIPSFRFYIDIALKPGLLNLEKEYIMKYYRSSGPHPFAIDDLTIQRRVYVIGENDSVAPTRFVKDMVNPVIHVWKVVDGNACA